jgi:hypothetical protein
MDVKQALSSLNGCIAMVTSNINKIPIYSDEKGVVHLLPLLLVAGGLIVFLLGITGVVILVVMEMEG